MKQFTPILYHIPQPNSTDHILLLLLALRGLCRQAYLLAAVVCAVTAAFARAKRAEPTATEQTTTALHRHSRRSRQSCSSAGCISGSTHLHLLSRFHLVSLSPSVYFKLHSAPLNTTGFNAGIAPIPLYSLFLQLEKLFRFAPLPLQQTLPQEVSCGR